MMSYMKKTEKDLEYMRISFNELSNKDVQKTDMNSEILKEKIGLSENEIIMLEHVIGTVLYLL